MFVRLVDERSGGERWIKLSFEDRRYSFRRYLVGESVTAEQESVASCKRKQEDLDIYRWVHTKGSRQHVPLRVACGRCWRQFTMSNELARDRVVIGQQPELPIGKEVATRVSDVCDRHPITFWPRHRSHCRQGCSHACIGEVIEARQVDRAVCRFDSLLEGFDRWAAG